MTSAQRARAGQSCAGYGWPRVCRVRRLGAALGWDQLKVSRIETGRFGVSIPDLSAVLNFYGVPE